MCKFKVFVLAILALCGLAADAWAQTPRTATATATVVNGFVVAVTVTDGGYGYTSAPNIQIAGGGGMGAVALATIANGSVEKITVMEVGAGYGANPAVIISAPPISRTAIAKATVVNGFIVSISVTDGGFGYQFPPSLTLSDGGAGSGAEVAATIANGAVDQILVKSAGNGYSPETQVILSAPAAPRSPFSEGLVAYYPFSGNANDESGTGNHGAILDATTGPDRFGARDKSLLLPGFGYVYINNTPSTESLPILTVSAWVKLAELPGASGMSIMSKVSDDGAALAWDFGIAPSGKLRLHANVKGWGSFDCNAPLQPGVWHHVAMVYSGAQLMGFVDGQLDGMSNIEGSIAPSDRPMRIGVYSPNLEPERRSFFKGQIDEVRLYSRALNPEEVNDLFHFEAPEGPWVGVKVKTVQVTLRVKPNCKYQLQSSLDVSTWTNVREPFVAATSKMVQDFSADEVGRYFRLAQVE